MITKSFIKYFSKILTYKNKKLKTNNWSIFREKIPPLVNYEKKELEFNFERLNFIRRAVMHPVRDIRISDDDFVFVHDFRNALQLDEWPNDVIEITQGEKNGI